MNNYLYFVLSSFIESDPFVSENKNIFYFRSTIEISLFPDQIFAWKLYENFSSIEKFNEFCVYFSVMFLFFSNG